MLKFVKGRIAGRAGLTALAVVGFVSPAFATGGTLSPVQSTLQTLVTTLTGPIATSLAILAVIALGFFAWSGRPDLGSRRLGLFGIVLVFGSTQIVSFFQSAVGS